MIHPYHRYKYIIYFILFCLAVWLCSCYSEKKMIAQAVKGNAVYPKKFSQLVREWYPCITKQSDTTIITKDSLVYVECPDADTHPESDWIEVKVDTVVKTKVIKVPVHLPIRTVYITTKIKDSAEIRTLSEIISEKDEAIDKLNKKIDNKNTWLKIFGVGTFLFFLLLLILYLTRKRNTLSVVK